MVKVNKWQALCRTNHNILSHLPTVFLVKLELSIEHVSSVSYRVKLRNAAKKITFAKIVGHLVIQD